MTVPTEPIYIGSHAVSLKFYAMPRQINDPRRIEGTFTLVGSEGVLTLDALVGPKGPPGAPSPVIRPEWGSPVKEAKDLPRLSTLDASDDGRAWFLSNGYWAVYSVRANEYVMIQGSIPGPVGATPDISISAEAIPAAAGASTYGPIAVEETGTTGAPHFHIKIPALPGPAGPAAEIELAADYDDSVPSQTGDFLVKLANDKWGPGSPTYFVPRKYTIPHNQFIDHTGNETRFLIASLNLPAQSFDWYPDVIGHVRLQPAILSSAQCEVEVRIGPTGTAGTGDSSPLCGLAPYDPTRALLDAATIAQIQPHFSDTADPNRSLTPDSDVGRCQAGTAYTIFVFVHKIGGLGSWKFVKTAAQLRVDVCPVVNI